jgi:hypothetical protein
MLRSARRDQKVYWEYFAMKARRLMVETRTAVQF